MKGTVEPMSSQLATARPERSSRRPPRTQPSLWRARRRRRRRRPSDPRRRRAKGAFGVAIYLRRALWSWWLWAGLAVWMLALDKWGWGGGFGVMAGAIEPGERRPADWRTLRYSRTSSGNW